MTSSVAGATLMSCLAVRDETGCSGSVALTGCALGLAEDQPMVGPGSNASYEAAAVPTRSAKDRSRRPDRRCEARPPRWRSAVRSSPTTPGQIIVSSPVNSVAPSTEPEQQSLALGQAPSPLGRGFTGGRHPCGVVDVWLAGGGRGIRTHGDPEATTAFEAAPFVRSGNPRRRR